MATTAARPTASDAGRLRTALRTCPLCEATCGLELTLDGDRVTKVRGDADDVFSHGFVCPKGTALGDLHHDPDRLRVPLVRGADGELAEATWDEAFAEVERRLGDVIARHGRGALAAYSGNPNAHTLAGALYLPALLRALGTRNLYSASSVDQMPKHVACGLMYGSPLSIPVPDLDRTDLLVILGANPMASNGSLMTAPDVRGRHAAIRRRGGRVVVIDPKRTRTAEVAGEHLPIRPGTDAHLLAAVVHVLFAEGLVRPGRAGALLQAGGVDAVRDAVADLTPERAAALCGIDADTIRALARDLAAAERAAVYGRVGTCTQRHGTLTSWLVEVVNALTGHLDEPGGSMFPRPAAGQPNTMGPPGTGRGWRFGRWASRVRGLPEALGELPVAALAEEIDTPGEGQVRALFTIGGNPARSTPNSARLEAALDSLDLLVCVDLYRNETTRRAHVVLPAPSPLERAHFDLVLRQFAVRNVASYSPPTLPRPDGHPDEWEILLRLAAIAGGLGADADLAPLDRALAAETLRRTGAEGVDVDDAVPAGGPERLLDLLLRAGPYDLTLADVVAAPHGLDLGALEPRLPEALRTPTGRIDLAPEPFVAALAGLSAEPAADGGMVLVGRRHLRSNNSWMHNSDRLARGRAQCTLQIHPDDAARLGLVDGGVARVTSRVGSVDADVEATDAIMRGIVSLPHGWGHDDPGARLSVAARRPGVNSNLLADEAAVDPISGTAVLNGIAVEVTALGPATT